MNTKTVLHIAPTPFFSDRGCHIRIEGVVNCLTGLGYNNLVCTYHHGGDVDGVETRRIAPIKNYTKTEAGPSKYKLWADWKLLWLVIREVRRVRPTVIHAHLHEGLMIGLVVKLLLFWMRIPLVADMQGSLVGELETHGSFAKAKWLKWPVKLIEACLMFFAKTIVCSSNHSLVKIKDEFGLDDAKITLVQDGADSAEKLSANERAKLRDDLSLPSDKRVIVYSGALLESKGLSELQRVIYLCNQMSDVHFLIIGYPDNELRAFLSENNLDKSCTLLGRVAFAELPKLLQLADIAIDPKSSDAGEGSGKMLNYLACALPVLAFNSKNNREFLPADVVLPDDVEGMVNQLQQLVADPDALLSLGQNNYAHFEANFSWDKTREQLAAVYRRLEPNIT